MEDFTISLWILEHTLDVILSIALICFGVYLKRNNARNEQRIADTKEECALNFNWQMAMGKLIRTNTEAVRDGKVNGNLTKALKEYETARQNYLDFMNAQGIENLNKN